MLTERKTHVKATNKCDVWSMGIMLYEMTNGCKPWDAYTIPEYLNNIKKRPIMFKQLNLSEDI